MATRNCTEKIREWYSLEDEREGKTMPEKRARRTFSEEQKKQLVELFNHGNTYYYECHNPIDEPRIS